MPPITRQLNLAAPGALNTFANMTDAETGLTFVRIPGSNSIIDAVNQPDPAATLTYQTNLLKTGGIDTGRRLFSSGMSPASAGRMAPGPINLLGGDYFFKGAQTFGGLAAYSIAVKFAQGF